MKHQLFAVLFLVSLSACGDARHEFRLLEPPLTFDREVATEFVEVFEENSDYRITMVPVPEWAETPLDAIESGYADLAFASNAQPYRQGVTAVMPLFPTALHVLYKRDRDADDPRALFRGAKVFAGPEGSSSRQLMTGVLQGLGMSESDVSYNVQPDELADVVVLYLPISPDRLNERLEELGAPDLYRMLSFGAPEDIGAGSAIDRTLFLNPWLAPFVVPVGTYDAVTPEPVVTVAVDKLLVASRDVPDAQVYDLINEIRRLQPALSARRPLLFMHLSEEYGPADSTFVLHPGSQAFTQRDAPDIYERYSGVAEVVVTLVIGLISGGYAMVQIYHRRRKNRIDLFYTDVMALRDSVTADSSLADREQAIARVRELQNRAFGMLVDEKVAADDSFRIFITLSNDIIAELGNQGS